VDFSSGEHFCPFGHIYQNKEKKSIRIFLCQKLKKEKIREDFAKYFVQVNNSRDFVLFCSPVWLIGEQYSEGAEPVRLRGLSLTWFLPIEAKPHPHPQEFIQIMKQNNSLFLNVQKTEKQSVVLNFYHQQILKI
jgi:hypothetical protein